MTNYTESEFKAQFAAIVAGFDATAPEPKPVDRGYSGNATQGQHYDRSRYVTAAEIAKHVRAAIKEAVKAGELPGKEQGFTYSVRSSRYSGGQSVSINVVGPGDTEWAFRPVTDEDYQAIDYGLTKVYTDEARRIGALVKSFGKAYTREDVDSQVDYFNVSCYVFAYCGSGGLCL